MSTATRTAATTPVRRLAIGIATRIEATSTRIAGIRQGHNVALGRSNSRFLENKFNILLAQVGVPCAHSAKPNAGAHARGALRRVAWKVWFECPCGVAFMAALPMAIGPATSSPTRAYPCAGSPAMPNARHEPPGPKRRLSSLSEPLRRPGPPASRCSTAQLFSSGRCFMILIPAACFQELIHPIGREHPVSLESLQNRPSVIRIAFRRSSVSRQSRWQRLLGRIGAVGSPGGVTLHPHAQALEESLRDGRYVAPQHREFARVRSWQHTQRSRRECGCRA